MQHFHIKTQREHSQGANNTVYPPKVIQNPQIIGRGNNKVSISEVQALLNNLKMSNAVQAAAPSQGSIGSNSTENMKLNQA